MDNFDIKKLPNGKFVIFSPYRSNKPSDFAGGISHRCPFCIDNIEKDNIIKKYNYINSGLSSVYILKNSYPFAHTHELVVLTQEHNKLLHDLSLGQLELIFGVYKKRFNLNKHNGQVVIFHNNGEFSGASIKHAHSQIIVIPEELRLNLASINNNDLDINDIVYTFRDFNLFTPIASQFPYEVWIAPLRRGRVYSQIEAIEIKNLVILVKALICLYKKKFGNDLSYNFVIYPKQDFYIRLIPRLSYTGGLELVTDLYTNTQDSKDVMLYIKEHLTKQIEEIEPNTTE